MSDEIKFNTAIERKHAGMPHFFVVPAGLISQWKLEVTTIVEVRLNGVDIGRRSLKRWDEQRWFIDLTKAQCQKARVTRDLKAEVRLQIASVTLPEELARLIKENQAAKAAWEKLTPGQQRMLREYVGEARLPATRKRRAVRALTGHS